MPPVDPVEAAVAAGFFLVALYFLAERFLLRTASSTPRYGSESYWESRYRVWTGVHGYEWYSVRLGTILEAALELDTHLLATTATTAPRIPPGRTFAELANSPARWRALDVGCGDSDLSLALYAAGWTNVVSIDYSATAIARASAAHPEGDYRVMDATRMAFDDASLDFCIDKGTIDGLLHGGPAMAQAVAGEIARVLRRGGLWLSVCVSDAAKFRACLGGSDGLWNDDGELELVGSTRRVVPQERGRGGGGGEGGGGGGEGGEGASIVVFFHAVRRRDG